MRKLLIVDDDEINGKILSKRLMKRGFQNEFVKSGKEALSYISLYPESIILLDIVMPEMDGIEVLKTLREKFSPAELPILMVSANDDTEKIIESLNLGANDYITKPVNVDIALARVNLQYDLLNSHDDSLKKKQLETVNAMVATYNHEINNPLTIALGSLSRDP
jgi:DNA-binding response OmpR family regulator